MNDLVINIIVKLAPVFILIGTGIILRMTKLINENSIDDLKKLIKGKNRNSFSNRLREG